MASHGDDTEGPGGDRPPGVDPSAPLPPELHPRGRRAGRAAQRAAAARAVEESALGAAPISPAPPRPRRAGQERSDVRRGIGLGTMVLAGMLSLAVVLTSGWAWWTWRGFKQDIVRVDAVANTAKPKKDIDGKDQNILIVGNDDRQTATDAELAELGTQRDGGSLNTDTMMLVHLPANGTRATAISFPRDSYVAIPGHGQNKLNSAYPNGVQDGHGNRSVGAQLLVRTIQNLTGLTIDHYVQVDLLGFYRISNAIGGVQVNLCAAQKEPNSGIDLPKGVSTIKGKQALAFVRQRYGLPNSDLDRIKRQQYFLSAAFRKLSSAGVLLNPFKLQDLLSAVTKSLQMDRTLDPLQLAKQMQDLTAGNLTFSTIPTNGSAQNDAGDVLLVDPGQVQRFVGRVIAQHAGIAAAPAKSVAPASFTVDVLNGSGTDGNATRNAAKLRQAGFTVGRVDSVAGTDATVVKYPAGMQAQAQLVVARVPGSTAQQSTNYSGVTLVLGSDGLSVGGQAPASSSTTAAPRVTSAADTSCIN